MCPSNDLSNRGYFVRVAYFEMDRVVLLYPIYEYTVGPITLNAYIDLKSTWHNLSLHHRTFLSTNVE